MIRALLWDVDGTLAETERDGHLAAYNATFAALGVPWRWSDAHYAELLKVTGGHERLLFDMASRADAPALAAERHALAREIHEHKNLGYAARVEAGTVPLRPGVAELVAEAAERGLQQAIVSTTRRVNADALLRRAFGADWARQFSVVVCGEDVRHKKPDPEAYQTALQRLGMGPLSTVAIEDSPGGVAAARGADVPVVVTRSVYFANEPIEGAIAIGPGLHARSGWRPHLDNAAGRVTLDDLIEWHARMDLVSQFD